MKKVFKYVLRFVLGIVALIAVYMLLGGLLSVIGTHPGKVSCEMKEMVFVSTNGVHLDVILPRHLIDEKLSASLSLPESVGYVSFGWGDKGFFIHTPNWSDLTTSTACRALFLKSETAMHVTPYKRRQSYWHPLEVCPSQVQLLNNFILGSFKTDEYKSFIEIPGAGYGHTDHFFEAKGSYSCLYTCNNWVNEALKKAKIKTSVWSPFDWGVLRHIK